MISPYVAIGFLYDLDIFEIRERSTIRTAEIVF